MIAKLDERHVSRGYDPYNSADQPHVMRAQRASPFKYRDDHAQKAADILAWNLEFNKRMNAAGAKRFGHDTFLVSGMGQPPI